MKRSIDCLLLFAWQPLVGHSSSGIEDQLQKAFWKHSARAALRYSGATCSRSEE